MDAIESAGVLFRESAAAMTLTAPPAETAWLLHHVLGFDAMDEADTAAVLAEAARFAEGVLAPLDQPGDAEGARWRDGEVLMPAGFADAFTAFAAGGWVGLAAPEAWGGQGLPAAIGLAAHELFTSANFAFGLCPMLTQDAILLIEAHGTPDQQARFLPRLIAGEWTGTMCLTEPQAGSDLAAVRARAVPDGAGRFRVSGQKIYITFGEHGMSENILHLVLARLPDAPAGSAGISLFAVPKRGADGAANGVRCLAIERKLGIHASPTCTLAFEEAAGELVGPAHGGLACMFAMMNAARLGVAMQGVAVAERAFRRALPYAEQRVQGGEPIVRHPDVRRMLLTMRALALGGRLLTLHAALAPAARAALLIPVAKAWATEAGVEAASLGVQVHGGAGFVEATGAAQHLRDARIAPIYEGTNGIQALTLLRRGLLRDQGAACTELLTAIAAAEDGGDALHHAARLAAEGAAWLRQAGTREAEAGATPFLHLLGTVTAAWLCARVAADPAAPAPARVAATVFGEQVLPRVHFLAHALATPSAALVGTQPIL
jgi:alkylation response protein AidB-like acyl-CoA dehydrogenase